MMQIGVLDDYQQRAHDLADWSSLGFDVTVSFFHDVLRGDELVSTLARFEVLVMMRERTPLPRVVLEQLRYVVTTGTRNASIDVAYLAHRGIPVSGTEVGGPDGGVSPPNEVAWGLIFATVKRIAAEDRAVRAGGWQAGLVGRLAGTTLGLIGLGRLGAEMVPPARAFGMRVITWSQNLTPTRASEVGIELVTKSDLLERADIISLHLVLSDRSRATIGAAELSLMKPTAVLINTSRGALVKEDALIDAVRTGRIGGAGLDVYDAEPLPPAHLRGSMPAI